MQPSEIWRRGVVMPHTSEVAQQINDWDIDESAAVDYLPIADETLFLRLWDIGLFATINKTCATLIDDYESEWLAPDHFPAAAIVVERLLKNNSDGDVGDFLRRLLVLIDRATKAKLPLYFEC